MTIVDPAALLACPAGCTCRGTYTGPERRSAHRAVGSPPVSGEPERAGSNPTGRRSAEDSTDLIPDVELDAIEEWKRYRDAGNAADSQGSER
jgi:hypothetical protein